MDFRDLAVAARVLRKSPVFALTAAFTTYDIDVTPIICKSCALIDGKTFCRPR